ncbi:helix-turn-helix transcriptional regulator, partial [Rhodococcus sp. IC4_135]|uniref:helix-turn-helix domain-containing protein n=1 Tax=Rhodococcus sp. IC4_135 TaxID=2715537 RepID=UPI0014249489|nr:helix-turn-helix transcriptional regulator [Rhodococcus sp. IC4_135]
MTNPHAEGAIPPITLKTRLMLARDYRGMTQAELAELIEVGIRSVIRFEKGEAVPKRGQKMAWAMATGVSYEWLDTGKSPSPDDDGGVSEPSSIPR